MRKSNDGPLHKLVFFIWVKLHTTARYDAEDDEEAFTIIYFGGIPLRIECFSYLPSSVTLDDSVPPVLPVDMSNVFYGATFFNQDILRAGTRPL